MLLAPPLLFLSSSLSLHGYTLCTPVSHRSVLYRLVQPSKRDRDCDSDQTECTCPPCVRYSLALRACLCSRWSCSLHPRRTCTTWKHFSSFRRGYFTRYMRIIHTVPCRLIVDILRLINKHLTISVTISAPRVQIPNEPILIFFSVFS